MSVRVGDEEEGKMETDELRKSRDENRDDEPASGDRDRLLGERQATEGGPERNLGDGNDEDNDDDYDDETKVVRIKWLADWFETFWENYRSTVWVILMTASMLTARNLFRGKFPYPLYFTFLLQIGANIIFEFWAMHTCLLAFLKTGLKESEWRFGVSFLYTFLHTIRLLICSGLSTLSLLLGVHVLMRYPNVHVIALLPLCSYVFDSVLLHVATIIRLHPRRKLVDYLHIISVLIVGGLLAPLALTDYRLEEKPLFLSFAAFGAESLSWLLRNLRSNVQQQRRDSKSFFIYERLIMGIPPLIASGIVAFKLEDTVDAIHRMQLWGLTSAFWTLLPGTMLLVLFGNGLTSVARPPTYEELFSTLEDGRPLARETIGATLHTAMVSMAIRAFYEPVLINWFQAVAFSVMYLVSLGPLHVGYYPQRFHNFIAIISRRKQRHTNLKLWRLFAFLIVSSLCVTVLLACTTVYWINTIAYSRSASTFINPSKPKLDYDYRPPRIRGLDVIIAHSNGHSHEALYKQLERLTTSRKVMGVGPFMQIFTKDPTLAPKSDPQKVKDFHIQNIPNIGGQTATFLHYILSKWATLPSQILFISSAKDGEFDPKFMTRLHEHFAVQGFPLADAEPKSGFLNLGESEVCDCNDCYDSVGWEDTFGLVPSMYNAVRPNITKPCASVLLSRGNNFMTSAARIRATPKDVWQLLYDGLMNPNLSSAWAHEGIKMPKMLRGEKRMGRWSPNGVYGKKDSLEEPLLGKTIERLWGVLLQCSTAEVAWRCPGLEKGWRLYGEVADCGCIDELIPGFA